MFTDIKLYILFLFHPLFMAPDDYSPLLQLVETKKLYLASALPDMRLNGLDLRKKPRIVVDFPKSIALVEDADVAEIYAKLEACKYGVDEVFVYPVNFRPMYFYNLVRGQNLEYLMSEFKNSLSELITNMEQHEKNRTNVTRLIDKMNPRIRRTRLEERKGLMKLKNQIARKSYLNSGLEDSLKLKSGSGDSSKQRNYKGLFMDFIMSRDRAKQEGSGIEAGGFMFRVPEDKYLADDECVLLPEHDAYVVFNLDALVFRSPLHYGVSVKIDDCNQIR